MNIESCVTPMHVTKYFEAGVLDKIENGSFRFGSTVEYSGVEKRFLDSRYRMSDQMEGRLDRIATVDSPIIRIGNITLDNWDIHTSSGVVGVGTAILNKYVFCCSNLNYDRNHHRIMNKGSPIPSKVPYEGDARLTHYAVIDFPKYLRALTDELYTRTDIFPDGFVAIEHHPVCYRDKNASLLTTDEILSGNRNMTRAQMLETIFVKPQRFSPEQEYRIVLHGRNDGMLAFDKPAVFVASKELRDSVIETGQFDPT